MSELPDIPDNIDEPLRLSGEIIEKPPPIWCWSWRHGLAYERICGIRDTQLKTWSTCWEDGVQVRELSFDAALVEELVNEAIRHFEDGDLDEADRYCEKAEATMVRRR